MSGQCRSSHRRSNRPLDRLLSLESDHAEGGCLEDSRNRDCSRAHHGAGATAMGGTTGKSFYLHRGDAVTFGAETTCTYLRHGGSDGFGSKDHAVLGAVVAADLEQRGGRDHTVQRLRPLPRDRPQATVTSEIARVASGLRALSRSGGTATRSLDGLDPSGLRVRRQAILYDPRERKRRRFGVVLDVQGGGTPGGEPLRPELGGGAILGHVKDRAGGLAREGPGGVPSSG